MTTKNITKWLAILLATSLILSLPAAAEDASDLLEQAIYAEETVGDLDAAITIYQRIVEDAEARRPQAAQALFRLGMCHLKAGDDASARTAFDTLLRSYPEEKGLSENARGHLADLDSALDLKPAVWQDGEFLQYRMSLPTGQTLGAIYLRAEATVVDGRDAWLLELRRFARNHSDNFGISRIWIDRQTQRPIRSTIRHGMLGNAEATFDDDGIRIAGKSETETVVKAHPDTFDNDQSMHLVRLLPLTPGYETRLNLLPIWTGQVQDMGLKVGALESCAVPAGDFPCHMVEFENGETRWYSADREQYPLKVETGGVILELAQIASLSAAEPVPFKVDSHDIVGMLPAGWLPFEVDRSGRDGTKLVRLLDPQASAITGLEITRCPSRGCPPLDKLADRELSGAKRRFADYKLRQDSWSDRTVGDRRVISFAGDFTHNDEPWVQYRNYGFVDDVLLEVIFRTPAERFDDMQADFDAVVEGFRAK